MKVLDLRFMRKRAILIAMSDTAFYGYVRETDSRSFNPTMNTPMIDYLSVIHPGEEWVHDKAIPKEIRAQRGGTGTSRIRPDFRCERLSLIVEFDGVRHYTDPIRVAKDARNDDEYCSMGYRVVRVPYWLALSREAIIHLFGVDVGCPMCMFTKSFSDNPDNGVGVSPASYCPTGLERFRREFSGLPKGLRDMVMEDLLITDGNEYGVPVLALVKGVDDDR